MGREVEGCLIGSDRTSKNGSITHPSLLNSEKWKATEGEIVVTRVLELPNHDSLSKYLEMWLAVGIVFMNASRLLLVPSASIGSTLAQS